MNNHKIKWNQMPDSCKEIVIILFCLLMLQLFGLGIKKIKNNVHGKNMKMTEKMTKKHENRINIQKTGKTGKNMRVETLKIGYNSLRY